MEKKYPFKYSLKFLTALMLLLLVKTSLIAQSEPFDCDFNAYLFQYNDIYALDLASGSSYLVSENVAPGNINAAAYNSSDGYIWGYLSSPSKSIIRIGKDYSTDIYNIPELPDGGNKYVGDISIDGMYYIRSGSSTYYSIDLNPESNNYLKYVGSQKLSQNISIHDWAFNAQDNKLYTVERSTNILYRIDAVSGQVAVLGVVPILSGLNYTFGAVYFDVDGNFYVSANQTGSVYKIKNVHEITIGGLIDSNIFAFGPASSLNDGARCPTAPVPQEDCLNGIDDDGDGLVDCDDPACSGVAACPEITLTSGANSGGLESNDRLSSLISKRNYDRAKANYTFDKSAAKKLKKGLNYGKSGKYSAASIPLADLVPLGIVGETSTIESSPADLLDLTNASDIYSVDYLKGSDNIGALMVIKTEEKVYEHSKFICDRFLGAQLLSVSNIQLREKDFIKSIIKQPDGNTEFALTFSARLNANNNFVIESHWNIDAYADNTAYYNFQIWSNTVDDLLALADEILNLLEANTSIADYMGSTPPPVFVKSAKYAKGKVTLNLVNNNRSDQLNLDGGIKKTETMDTESMSFVAPIDGYLDSVSLETGSIFDFGFRVNNSKGGTPDDLFVADAPWGLDSSTAGTSVDIYEVTETAQPYMEEGYPVERNIKLKGNTSNYIGVYRALSPRFTPVDLSDYSKLAFDAAGSGLLEVKLTKGDGAIFTAQVNLAANSETFVLSDTDFEGPSGLADFSSLKVINFNLVSENGTEEEKELVLSNVNFNNKEKEQLFVLEDTNKSLLYPNPVEAEADIYFFEEAEGSYTFELFDLSGKKIMSHEMQGDTKKGQNKITVKKHSLSPGLYLYKLTSSNDKIWSSKLMIQ
ncbi:putative secreted protein (Por secretion system target) [Flavobacteriaceae bacterium MAR_2009_75]|nr:putative secreted protein (Por secretion system target) [Flavobacteriaceae bacterium MAR_2009_75]